MRRVSLGQCREALTDGDMERLLEKILEGILPFVKESCLSTVGQTPCLSVSRRGYPPGRLHCLDQDKPVVIGEDTLSLKLRGLYCWDADTAKGDTDDDSRGTAYIWGISPESRWIMVRIRYQRAARQHLSEIAPGTYFAATEVKITRATPSKITRECGTTPMAIFRFLVLAMGYHCKYRDALFAKILGALT